MGDVPGAPSVDLHGKKLTQGGLVSACGDAWVTEESRFVLDEANFEGTSFQGPIHFERAEFGIANFRGATFKGPVNFNGAYFRGDVSFDSATFEGSASFKNAHFHGHAIFEHPEDVQQVPEWPEEVTFKRWADFRQATFEGMARFGGANFERRARFRSVSFRAGAVFTGATFTRARTIGPLAVSGELDLDRVVFGGPVRIRVAGGAVSCKGTQFQSLTTISLWSGDITLEEAAFAEPSVVAGSLADPRPRVLSLEGANVAHLTLADLDLRNCSFLGVHNLDGLRFEGGIELPEVQILRRTNRQAIFDEVELPRRRERNADAGVVEPVTPERVARAYRALRKGREDSKDAPGAADFYYGEMEMRRRAARGVERAVLTMYWLLSGYGLRASRALIALAVTVVLFAWGFQAWGFDPDQGYWKSLLFSAESTSSLFRVPELGKEAREQIVLTDPGHVLQIGMRLLGPLFFGLALLALRGRVKR